MFMFMFGSEDEFSKRYWRQMLERLYQNSKGHFEESLDTQGDSPDSAGAELVIRDSYIEEWENLQTDVPVSGNYRHQNN